ncbi:MAG: hypothetical protein HY270_00450 [Deltaproteobacteria bacterium]|nr:hypothetical protein [Deltaproteobacteria bacterium]
MKASILVLLTLLIPASAFAGLAVRSQAPALGDAGLIGVGVGLFGAGLLSLRNR